MTRQVARQHASREAGGAAVGTLSPAPVTDLARLAATADALGLAGLAVPGVRMFGTRVCPVLTVDAAAHARRRQAGCAAPMLDADTLAVWEWPQSAAVCPPSVVRLRGVLVPAARPPRPDRPGRPDPSWATAAATALRWAGFAATALLLPTDDASELCRLECGYAGIGLAAVAGADVRLVQPGRPGRSEKARRRTLDRWVEEQLYGRLLSAGVLAT